MSDLFFRIIRHLLPRAQAWRLTVEKTLRRFFEGLSGVGSDAREFVDDVYDDGFPGTTRELAQWEQQFGLKPGSLTTQERRDRLAGVWKATGGQDPRYVQDTLRAAGFDVYVHEWWAAGTNPPVVRNPLVALGTVSIVRLGSDIFRLGNEGARLGNVLVDDGFLLTNRGLEAPAPPAIPTDSAKWPYILYIGGQTFPDPATVPADRRLEFETLLLQICPTQQWLGMIINYS